MGKLVFRKSIGTQFPIFQVRLEDWERFLNGGVLPTRRR